MALQGLTLDIREGEICVVLGPSGSGKSTLLRMLAALDSPTAGSVHVLGRDLARLSRRGRAAYRSDVLGYADQHYWRALASELEVRELVGVRLGLAGLPRTERLGRAGELLERVGLLDRAEAHPRELSGGEQQRVAICAALAHRPRLLLADEPTGELDAANARRVYEAIVELAREGGTHNGARQPRPGVGERRRPDRARAGRSRERRGSTCRRTGRVDRRRPRGLAPTLRGAPPANRHPRTREGDPPRARPSPSGNRRRGRRRSLPTRKCSRDRPRQAVRLPRPWG